MREVTQDETVHSPNDGIHLVVILTTAMITGWLNIADWIFITFIGLYFAFNYIWIDKKFGDKKERIKLFKYAGVLLILWMVQKLVL